MAQRSLLGTAISRILGALVIFAILMGYNWYSNRVPAPKEDISRVEASSYSITYDQLADLLKETDSKATVEKDDKVDVYEANGKKEFFRTLELNNHTVRCYSPEENGKITAVTISSSSGMAKNLQTTKNEKGIPSIKPTKLEFKSKEIDALKYNASLINYVLNSTKSKNDFKSFIKAHLGSKITTGDGTSGDSNIYLGVDSRSLVFEFVPAKK